MVKSYLIIALRVLFRNRFYSLVNILGLGVAMALCIVGYVNYQFSQSFDSFHDNADKIHTVASYRIVDGVRQNWAYVPTPMGPAIKNDIPGVAKYARIALGSGSVRYGERVFNQTYHFVDDDFFDMFTFPIIAGSQEGPLDKSSLILSREIADKYFGDKDPIGRQIIISPDGTEEFSFVVSGIVDDSPKNSSFRLGIVMSFGQLESLTGDDPHIWSNWNRATLIQLEETAVPSRIEEQLQVYVQRTKEANLDWNVDGHYLIPFSELAHHTQELNANLFVEGMHPAAIIAPSLTALLVLLLACFNFVNTSIAFASRRLKEIGVRKVMGGMRSQLVKQFLGENLVLCCISLFVAVALAETFVPAYDSLWPELSLTMNYSDNPGLVYFLASLLLFTAIAAGAYPAWYVSRYNPIYIFRGTQKLGGTNRLIRVLLTFQLALSMTSLIAAIILAQNAEFIKTIDLGYDREHILVVRVNGESEFNQLKNAMKDHPGVLSISGSRHLMGMSYVNADFEIDQTDRRINMFDVGENYLETLSFRLVDGRTFDARLATDLSEAIIVNEMLLDEVEWESAIGQHMTYRPSDSAREYRVIGVVKNFHPNGVWSRVRPTAVRFAPAENYRYLSIKCDSINFTAVASSVEQEFKRLIPHRVFRSFWQDELLAGASQVNNSIRLVFLYIAIMVMAISCMGLFALVSLNIAKRTREIGIRKVLGATVPRIGTLIGREFIWLVGIGSLLASVMGYFLLDSLLSSIWTYHCDIGPLPFVIATVVTAGVVILTVGFQVIRIASTNPVDAIRHE
jgi:ABC-type lipoprotein release transport system permease subunit